MAYNSAFARWDEQAWVRSKPHRTASFEAGLHFFSPDLCLAMRHPSVLDAPDGVREAILVQYLYAYLEFTVRLETGPVNAACAVLRSTTFTPALPDPMRADALRIYADEAGHAEMSHALLTAVRAHTGIEPIEHEPGFLTALAAIRASHRVIPPDLLEVFFAIVSETLITAMLTRLTKDSRVQMAVRQVAQDHAADEARHNAYFRRVFEFLWPRLTEPSRQAIGLVLPDVIHAFLAPDERHVNRILAGFSAIFGDPAALTGQLIASDAVRFEIARAARPTIRMLKAAGVLADTEVNLAFDRHGLLI